MEGRKGYKNNNIIGNNNKSCDHANDTITSVFRAKLKMGLCSSR